MKVLLASAPHADTFGYSMPSPGLLRLGGALRDAGHTPALEDLAYRLMSGDLGGAPEGGDTLADDAAAWLRGRGRPDVFGLSVMGATLPIALEIARRLRKEWPGTLFLLGGPGTHGTTDRVLERFGMIDAIVRGEGERTLVEVCDAWARARRVEDLAGIDGVSLRRDGRVHHAPDRAMIRDLSELPTYAWDLLPPITAYKAITGEDDGLVPVDSGRGCVYDCSFCSIGRTWSRRSRPLPARRLADEVAALRGIPGAKRAYLCHDLFGADRKHAVEFASTLLERGVDVPWEVRARADHLDAELLRLMGRAGCDRVLLGIESASAVVRRRHQKGMSDAIDLLAVVDDCAAAGITPILSLILGLPGEGDAELDETLAFCSDAALRAGVNLSLHLVNPQPGCGLGDEFGAESRPVDHVPPDMALGAGHSAAERALIEAHPDLFSTWALLPYADGRLDELVFLKDELAEVLMRYPRTFAALRIATGNAGALHLARRLRADGRTFETFARELCDGTPSAPLVEGVLAWESALVRVAARGTRRPAPDRFRLGAELLESSVDLGSVTAALRHALDPARAEPGDLGDAAGIAARLDGGLDGRLDGPPATFAVTAPVALPGRLGSVRTLRLGAGAARLARAMSEANAVPDLPGADAPGARAVVHELVRLGVLVPPAGDARYDAARLAPESPPSTTPEGPP